MLEKTEFGIWFTEVERSASNLFVVGRRKSGLLAFCAKMGKSIVIESIGMSFCTPEGITRFGKVVHLEIFVCVFFKMDELLFVFN